MQADHEVKPQVGTIYAWNGLASDGESSADYPLSAACARCGRFIARRNPADQWQHRAPDAEPVSEPTNGEWW